MVVGFLVGVTSASAVVVDLLPIIFSKERIDVTSVCSSCIADVGVETVVVPAELSDWAHVGACLCGCRLRVGHCSYSMHACGRTRVNASVGDVAMAAG